MNLDRTTETILIFLSVLVILFTALYVERVAMRNNVSSEQRAVISLTGTRLSDKVYASLTTDSQEESEGSYCYSYSCILYNRSGANISNWSGLIDVPPGTQVMSMVDVDATVEGDLLIIAPEYYNVNFADGESIPFGFTISTKEKYYPKEIRFRGFGTTLEHANFYRNILIAAFAVWGIAFIGFFVTRFNFRNYRQKQQNDVRIILQSMNTFISFIDAKDPYTRGHSRRVAMYAAEIAKRMHLSEDEVQNIYYAGLLHDAGQISVPDAVLNKPGKLTDEERRQIQDHTVAGGKMLKQLSSLRGIRETALYHHERYDGNGYPEGIRGEAIPLYARIVGVADSYDAMSSNRVYRRHLNKDEIIEEIQRGAGTQFDPEIVVYMVDMINDGYVNVVKMETADNEEGTADFHLTEDDIPGVYMGGNEYIF